MRESMIIYIDDFIILNLKVGTKICGISLSIYGWRSINIKTRLSINPKCWVFISFFISTFIVLSYFDTVVIINVITDNWAIFFPNIYGIINCITIPLFICCLERNSVSPNSLILMLHNISLIDSWDCSISEISLITKDLMICLCCKRHIGLPNSSSWTDL